MKNLKSTLLLFTLLIFISCQTSAYRNVASDHHVSANVHQLVSWETGANAVSKRSNELIQVEHYEIPLRLLQRDFDESLDPQIKSSLMFKKNNETYVRWLINPEDSKWHLEVKAFLEKHNVDSTPKKFFDGYLTASRSMILVNPENGANFSLKVSTNLTGGNWTDKKQTWKDAQQVRNINKWVHEILPKMKSETLVVMEEPLAMGIKEIDHGMIMRSLNNLPEDKFFYLPAFSALHDEEGARIAKLNGATEHGIANFWDKHLNQPLANAMAEYFSMTGMWYDSPHAQNFLVELDRDMKPTGRIVLRDLGDAYILDDFVKNTKWAWITSHWEDGKVQTGKINTGIGLLKGNTPPKWMSGLEYKEFGWNFYRTFEKRFSELSGIPQTELTKTDSKEIVFDYSKKVYPTTSEAWKKFTRFAACMNGEAQALSGEKCLELYEKRHVKIDCMKAATAIINAR